MKGFTPNAFDYCGYSGYKSTKAKVTGFFHVEQVEGKWWSVDPDGHLFLSMAVPGMGAGDGGTRVSGREGYYKALPPPEVMASLPAGRNLPADPNSVAPFRAWNLYRRYGPEWPAKAADMELQRAAGWGLTTIVSYGASPQHKLPYITYFQTLPRNNDLKIPMYLGIPDIYSDEYARFLEESAKATLPLHKDDPWLVGYFIGNEPP